VDETTRAQINQAWQARVAATGEAFRVYFLRVEEEEATLTANTAPARALREKALSAIRGNRQLQEEEIWTAYREALRPHQAALQARLQPARSARIQATQAAFDRFEESRALAVAREAATPELDSVASGQTLRPGIAL
jgi:hypothetical protein